MKSIDELVASPTPYSGSEHTFAMVADQIEKRFGLKARKEYDARANCRTFAAWLKLNYRVKPHERSLRSITYIEKKDATGNVIKTYPRVVHLFFISQVEKI